MNPFFGTTVEQRIAEERHDAARRAARMLVAGEPAAARTVLRCSVEYQASVAGIHIDLDWPEAPPRGTR